jgi:cell division protein FtsW (lipid II flippase)
VWAVIAGLFLTLVRPVRYWPRQSLYLFLFTVTAVLFWMSFDVAAYSRHDAHILELSACLMLLAGIGVMKSDLILNHDD